MISATECGPGEEHRLDVAVVYTGERAYLRRLVADLGQQARRAPLRLVLIDNATGTADRDFAEHILQGSRLPVAVLRNATRRGYSANMQQAMEQSEAAFLLALNTDMWFPRHEPCLATLLEFMDERPRCGAAGCCVFGAEGQYRWPARRFPTPGMIAARRLVPDWLLTAARRAYLYQHNPIGESYACDWVSGCCMLVRREARREVGNWDPGYRKYFEDVDFCRRLWQAGWTVEHCGATLVYHDEQRASQDWRSPDARIHIASYLRYLRQWGWSGLWGRRPQRRGRPAPERAANSH